MLYSRAVYANTRVKTELVRRARELNLIRR
ncbi:hypothetical protein [Shigella phage ESh22]|nr:hypothetical protein [Shigella phage ESh21]URY12721.1 hypothetical protein [Shigella phage ESh22]